MSAEGMKEIAPEAQEATKQKMLSKASPDRAIAVDKQYRALIEAFDKKIEELSNRQLKRVVSALMKVPFLQEGAHLPYLQERELFFLGYDILDCRLFLMRALMEANEDQINELLAAQDETAKSLASTEGQSDNISQQREESTNEQVSVD